MRVLLTGGGTSGHVNPALAIADIFRSHYPDCEIAFVGTPDGIENRLVPQAGYELYKIKIEGINGKKRSKEACGLHSCIYVAVFGKEDS